MFATLVSATLQGIEAEPVQVEVNAGEAGEPRLILVGLPDASVKESDDRVFSALCNTGFRPPRTRTTINLAPGNLRKEGPIYDLPIALGILAATGQVDGAGLDGLLVVGELSLSGQTRPVRGAFAMTRLAKRLGKRGILLPPESAEEARVVGGIAVYPAGSLAEAVRLVASGTANGETTPQPRTPEGRIGGCREPASHSAVRAAIADSHASNSRHEPNPGSQRSPPDAPQPEELDFSEIRGQLSLRRAVEVAVAGGHNLLVVGAPGSGKTMVAKRIPTLMPPPSHDEYLEILAIQSAAGRTLTEGAASAHARPFRAPHHRTTDIAMIGGGAVPRPGEISLAHRGVLFLDELPEFRRSTLEVLRQPLEDGTIAITRSSSRVQLPAAFMLVAAMNPCPCGHLGDPRRQCRCTPNQIARYRGKVSGPLLDRIDLHVEAPAVPIAELRNKEPGETSAAIRERVVRAREVQNARCGTLNARITRRQIAKHCALPTALECELETAMEKLSLSVRAYDRILKVARTIADLGESSAIRHNDLMEAIRYRTLDRAPGP